MNLTSDEDYNFKSVKKNNKKKQFKKKKCAKKCKKTPKPKVVKIKTESKMFIEAPIIVFENEKRANDNAEIPSIVNTNNFNPLNFERYSEHTSLVEKHFKKYEDSKISTYNNCLDHDYSLYKKYDNSFKNGDSNCPKPLSTLQTSCNSSSNSVSNKNPCGILSQNNVQTVPMMSPSVNLVPIPEFLSGKKHNKINEPIQIKQNNEVIEGMYELLFGFIVIFLHI